MPTAGFCSDCGANVWLDERWSCPSGHGWDKTSGWYDPDTGAAVTPPWVSAPAPAEPASAEPAPAPAADAAPAPGTRAALLADMLATFAQYPGYTAAYGTDTDIAIDNEVARASWGTGKKKVEFTAAMKADEAQRTLYYWEMLKESGGGLSFGTFESESYGISGMKRSGKKKETVIGPGGVAMSYDWDYGATRRIVESVAERHGFRVKVVLLRKGACW